MNYLHARTMMLLLAKSCNCYSGSADKTYGTCYDNCLQLIENASITNYSNKAVTHIPLFYSDCPLNVLGLLVIPASDICSKSTMQCQYISFQY